MLFETKRLYARQLTADDFDDAAEILTDPQTMYAYPSPKTREEVHAFIQKHLDNYEKHGYSWWAFIDKESGEYVGHAGLLWLDLEGEDILEVGYHVKKKHWGKGYATEMARAVKRWAFAHTDAERVYSLIAQTNRASVHVAEKNGMRLERAYTWYNFFGKDVPHFAYMARRQEAESSAPDAGE
ncbi:MAG: GNAT family N-acetyltransferase [Christensenellales bacterium]|jgi:ribosomal-protein-alanine N-acetyltransferase